MQQKSKTLILKRAYLPNGHNESLEQFLIHLFEALPIHADRAYQFDLFKTFRLAYLEKNVAGGGIFVRLTSSEAGPTGILDLKKSEEKIEVEEFNPPDNSEFVDEELILLVRDNHILASGLGRRDTMLQNMLVTLGRKASIVTDDFRVAIADVPNKTELSRIGEIGVKSIELSVTGYLGTLEAAEGKSRIPGMAAFEKIFMTSDDVDEIFRRANTNGRLTLSRGRLLKEEIKDEWLTDIGRLVVEENSTEYKLI